MHVRRSTCNFQKRRLLMNQWYNVRSILRSSWSNIDGLFRVYSSVPRLLFRVMSLRLYAAQQVPDCSKRIVTNADVINTIPRADDHAARLSQALFPPFPSLPLPILCSRSSVLPQQAGSSIDLLGCAHGDETISRTIRRGCPRNN